MNKLIFNIWFAKVFNVLNTTGIARERIQILIDNALINYKSNEELAEKQARLAMKIAMSLCLRMPYDIRQLFCKRCKKFIIPGVSARVRIGRSRVKAVRITCLNCMHVYHKLL